MWHYLGKFQKCQWLEWLLSLKNIFRHLTRSTTFQILNLVLLLPSKILLNVGRLNSNLKMLILEVINYCFLYISIYASLFSFLKTSNNSILTRGLKKWDTSETLKGVNILLIGNWINIIIKNNKAPNPLFNFVLHANITFTCVLTSVNGFKCITEFKWSELLNKVIWSNNINQNFPNWCSSEPVPRVALQVKGEFCG